MAPGTDSSEEEDPDYRDSSGWGDPKIINRLPQIHEIFSVRELILQPGSRPARTTPLNDNADDAFTDDAVADLLGACRKLETVDFSGVPSLTDRTVIILARTASRLRSLSLAGCSRVSDVGVLELLRESLPLERIVLTGVGVTDPAVSALVKSCARLSELDLCELPLLTPLAMRDVWTFARRLRRLRVARCPLLTDQAFPSFAEDGDGGQGENGAGLSRSNSATSSDAVGDRDKPLPHRPSTWLETLGPLVLPFTADTLRVLDLSFCTHLSDAGIAGVVAHAPRLQSLGLSGCTLLTDASLETIARLGASLDMLSLAYVSNITDAGVVKVVRECLNLRCLDLSFCRNLTDMSVFEVAGLVNLQRLNLVRVQKLTDLALYALAEHATGLQRLHLSYCDRLSLESIHLLLKRLVRLQHVTATGIPALRRRGVERFSDPAPASFNADQQAVFRVFSEQNVGRLRRFLDKEQQRVRAAEASNIPFAPRSDDEMDLY
ncbi:hypothetical protein HGRIS_009439 [Hohenbuehelia grisea]|uniref:F-box/LRR-repeat protein 15-like leucin rich repeat domain-containing protein n=1 Tax=Hohenbuehelia grisea TaxID=104357 RepID=A0ABR3J147_9AGAR